MKKLSQQVFVGFLLPFILLPATDPASASFVPPQFRVPTQHEFGEYKLVPLGPSLAQHDYDAYMSSIEHLQKTFSSGSWPNKNITMADALKDVEGEIARFQARKSFTYAVLTGDGKKELGCVYIRPSKKTGYDAQVSMWVTAEQFKKGFDAELFQHVKQWLASDWPFQHVAYPRRDIQQDKWNALPDK